MPGAVLGSLVLDCGESFFTAMDEPSLGLAPLIVKQIFDFI
jgi:ABC-type branched-subunit amino acid transport system ATPase component